MSFAVQEQVLFELLFNQKLRHNFCTDGLNALSSYSLTPEELADFSTIRPEALALDAKMRINLILARFCREFPLSFSLTSSLEGGEAILTALVDCQTMQTAIDERATVFGTRLRDKLANCVFSSSEEHTLVMAIVETELSMAWTASQLKEAVLKNGTIPQKNVEIPESCLELPVKIAEYVSVSIIPQSYEQLKKALCPCRVDELWRHLCDMPLLVQQRKVVLQNLDPRLLAVRADVKRMSACTPEIKHITLELSEGFAPLLQHLDGRISINELLNQFAQSGAPQELLQSVRNGFLQLWKMGMLTLA